MKNILEKELTSLRLGLPPQKNAGIFGANISVEQAGLVILEVPWDITCSYGHGSAFAPKNLLKASHQLDFADEFWGPAYELGITMVHPPKEILSLYRKKLAYSTKS